MMSKLLDFPFQYFPQYFDTKGLFEKIQNQISLHSDTILIGRGETQVEVPEKRKTAWLSHNKALTFEYSGKVMSPKPIPTFIEIIRLKLQEDFGISFDGILVNFYPDGNTSMGYHSDPIEDKWSTDFIILSLGATREFVFRDSSDKEKKYNFQIHDGDMIYMYDNCQEKYEHCVKKCKTDITPRISLVFKKSIN